MVVLGSFLILICFYLLLIESPKKRRWIREPSKSATNQTYCFISLTMISCVQAMLVLIIFNMGIQILMFMANDEKKYSETPYKIKLTNVIVVISRILGVLMTFVLYLQAAEFYVINFLIKSQ